MDVHVYGCIYVCAFPEVKAVIGRFIWEQEDLTEGSEVQEVGLDAALPLILSQLHCHPKWILLLAKPHIPALNVYLCIHTSKIIYIIVYINV